MINWQDPKMCEKQLNVLAQKLKSEIHPERFSHPDRDFFITVWKGQRIYINLLDRQGSQTTYFAIKPPYYSEERKRGYALEGGAHGYNTLYEIKRAIKEVMES
jgi:hypothetical protein